MSLCPNSAPFFGFMGITCAIVFCNMGSAYGTAKAGVGISSMAVMNPGAMMKNCIPVVLAGILGIYGLIMSVVLNGSIKEPVQGSNNQDYAVFSSYSGFAALASGLACGLSSLAAGICIGVVGDAGVRAVGQQEKVYVGMILILIFGEAVGLYGLIVAIILSSQDGKYSCTGP